MLASEAVDAAVARLDFTPLSGQRVFFETKYIQHCNGIGFVNADYVISSLRQQMAAAGLLLVSELDESDFVVEGRVGVLGADAHEIVYGIPSNSAIGSAASIAASASTGTPAPATIPELSLARRNEQAAAAKIGLFAYSRGSREVVWQSGSSVARATAKDLWVFGVGPFQRGSIYDGKVQFAGDSPVAPIPGNREGMNGTIMAYDQENVFRDPERVAKTLAGKEKSEKEEAPKKEVASEPGQLPADSPGWFARPIPGRMPDGERSLSPVQQAGGEVRQQE